MRLGSDPEIFIKDRFGKHLSIIGKVGGSKWAPLQVPHMAPGFTLQEDNVVLEFGVPPASSAQEFVKHIRSVMQAGLSTLPGTRFSRLSCTIMPEEEMQDPGAHIFGCEPDYNAWTGEENHKPSPPHPLMRSAGGHVHVETTLDKRDVIKAMDLFLGVPSVLLDSGSERRQLYGKAGAFRPKSYGVEYRTLSNFWIFRPKLIEWVWNQTEKALSLAKGNDFGYTAKETRQIQECINNGDTVLAKSLVKEWNIELC
jgi:hypothetical protein